MSSVEPLTSASASSSSSSHVKRYRPYFSPEEVERMSSKQRGKLSLSREEKVRQQACSFIEAVGVRCGFPRRTIATAQTLYMRFHLFFPYSEFHYVEVAMTTLYVSSKLHDTLKKPRDIIIASHSIRSPHLIKRSNSSVTTGGTVGGGVIGIDPSAIDPAKLENERRRILSIERLVLESMCFAFGVQVPFPLVIKLGKKLELDRADVQHAWRVAVDCHRTPAPLSFPPHVVALASLYTAALLINASPTPHNSIPESKLGSIIQTLGSPGSWETTYSATATNIDDVTHFLLDMYITILSNPSADPLSHLFSPSPVSPKEQPRQSSSQSSSTSLLALGGLASPTSFRLSSSWTAQGLTELKIHLRDRARALDKATATMKTEWGTSLDGSDDMDRKEVNVEDTMEGIGQNDATVRFLWD